MTPSKLKQLKKRRDAIRNRLQADILKLVQFGEDEGLTQFEAAHAVLDSMLFKIDQKDRKSTRLNSSHIQKSRMPSSA